MTIVLKLVPLADEMRAVEALLDEAFLAYLPTPDDRQSETEEAT